MSQTVEAVDVEKIVREELARVRRELDRLEGMVAGLERALFLFQKVIEHEPKE